MVTIALTILTSILVAISALHIYWAFGGKWASENVVPDLRKGTIKLFQPRPIDTLLVAALLLIAAGLFLWQAGVLTPMLPTWIRIAGVWTVTIVFLLRAIGDFHYFGFFKSIRDTGFGRLDTLIYSPLCLFIAILALIVVIG